MSIDGFIEPINFAKTPEALLGLLRGAAVNFGYGNIICAGIFGNDILDRSVPTCPDGRPDYYSDSGYDGIDPVPANGDDRQAPSMERHDGMAIPDRMSATVLRRTTGITVARRCLDNSGSYAYDPKIRRVSKAMMIESRTDKIENSIKIEDSIKAELEHVYVMASYIDAEEGRLEILRHLVSAAIDEMESLIEKPSDKHPRLIQVTNVGGINDRAERG